jgi:hypothetical protein
MPFCTDSNWTIDMYKDVVPPVRLDTLFFELKISNGTIMGKVFVRSAEISNVDGRCQGDAALNAAAMSLTFNWGTTRVLMTGVAHVDGVFTRFKGRFVAFPPQIQPSLEIKRMTLIPPDVGDTGTGNGMQT